METLFRRLVLKSGDGPLAAHPLPCAWGPSGRVTRPWGGHGADSIATHTPKLCFPTPARPPSRDSCVPHLAVCSLFLEAWPHRVRAQRPGSLTRGREENPLWEQLSGLAGILDVEIQSYIIPSPGEFLH